VDTQPTPTVTRDDVVRIVHRDFPTSQAAGILDILDQYGTISWQRERDRVQLAVLKLAGGRIDTLKTQTESACCDYRDVLSTAEYPAATKRWSSLERSTPEQRSAVYEADWTQYQTWLTRA